VYDKLLKPRQSFLITPYLWEELPTKLHPPFSSGCFVFPRTHTHNFEPCFVRVKKLISHTKEGHGVISGLATQIPELVYKLKLQYLVLEISSLNFTTDHLIPLHAVAQLVEALHYNPEGREFGSQWFHWKFSLTYGPGIDSVSNRNEY
jgi:hypothetical protein